MKEVTHEDWLKNPTPRMMWVWDNDEDAAVQLKVIYLSKEDITYPVIALTDNETATYRYKHCAEIEKQRRMTNKELARWLREKPTREYTDDRLVYSIHTYLEICANEEVDGYILIREDDGEWREPLVDVGE